MTRKHNSSPPAVGAAQRRLAVKSAARPAKSASDAPDEIVCQLCHEVFRAITPAHLRSRHDFEGDHPTREYKQRFQVESTCSRLTRHLARRASIAATVRRGVHWRKSRILAELKQRAEEGKPLAPTRVRPTLYAAANRLFGSWRTALTKAGLNPPEHLIAGRWNRETIIEAILALHREGRPLTHKRVRLYARSLHMAAQKHLGSWGNALRDAGLDPAEHREPHKWSVDRAREWIKTRLAQGRPITAGHVPMGLINCVIRETGGGWGAFVESTGRTYPGLLRTTWSAELVTRTIRDRKRRGLPLNPKAVIEAGGTLVAQGQKYFGSWDDALRAAGVDPARVRLNKRWSKKEVLDALRARYSAGLPMDRKSTEAQQPRLVGAVKKRIPHWADALRAAGLDPSVGKWQGSRGS